jgi:hypothetical protein
MPSLLPHRRRRAAVQPEPPTRDVWTARRFIPADPPDVLASLTDPELITLWAPIDFEFDGLRGRRLRPGSHAYVNGSLAGVAAEFEVEVLRADEQGFDLEARGPVALDVAYRIAVDGGGVLVDAEIKLGRERGLNARVLRAATSALLSGGALDRALRKLAGEIDEAALLAA